MELDYNIERIQNGYIVTGNDGTQTKRFFNSIDKLVQTHISEELRELEKEHQESRSCGKVLRLQFSLKVVNT